MHQRADIGRRAVFGSARGVVRLLIGREIAERMVTDPYGFIEFLGDGQRRKKCVFELVKRCLEVIMYSYESRRIISIHLCNKTYF